MRRWIAMLLCAAVCMSLAACGQPAVQEDDGKLTILTTIFPEYDWLRNLTEGSGNVEVKLLIDKGVDLHSYQPSVRDIVDISTCDVFIYTGGASDVWVEEAVETAMNEDMVVIDLMERLELYRDLCEEEHEHDHEEHGHDHEHTGDEHIWLSLKNAQMLCHDLTMTLQGLDGENSERYAANYFAYMAQLEALDEAYATMAAEAGHQDIVFADRFPFTYLMEDYGLTAHAAYEGCSAETEVGFETFARLADTLNTLSLEGVVVIDDSDRRIANTVIASAGDDSREIYTLHSMQAVSRRQIDSGLTYLRIMEENLDVFRKVLN